MNYFLLLFGKKNRRKEIDDSSSSWFYARWTRSRIAHTQCNMIERNGSSWCTFIIPIFCFSSVLCCVVFLFHSQHFHRNWDCVRVDFFIIFFCYFRSIVSFVFADVVAAAASISFFIHTSSRSKRRHIRLFCVCVFFSFVLFLFEVCEC